MTHHGVLFFYSFVLIHGTRSVLEQYTMAEHVHKDEIIRRIKEGNYKDLNDLYTQLRSEFLTWGMNHFKLADKDSMIDAWQNAIIAFYQQIASGKLVHLECEVKTYLFVLAKRYLIKAVERNGRTESLDVHKMSLHEMETSMEFDWDDPWHFQKRQVTAAMQALGVQCKELLNLKFLEELSLDEIMLRKGYASLNATSASISRCLRNLKDLIKDTLQNDR